MEDELMPLEVETRDIFSFFDDDKKRRNIAIGVLAAIAVVSLLVLGAIFSTPDAYSGTIASLDHKKETVTALVAGSAGASSAITLLPGDAATPVAEKLMDLSSDFLIVLVAIYLEKYLLTILGFAAFRVLIPVGCVMVIVGLLLHQRPQLRMTLAKLAAKLVLFAVAAVLIVPASVGVSDMIEATFASDMNETIVEAEQVAQEAEAANEEQTVQQEEAAESTNAPDGGVDVIGAITSIPGQVAETAGTLAQNAQNLINEFIEALAVMVVTSCVIPILVLLFFFWLVRTILGIQISVPVRLTRPRTIVRK